MNNPTPESVYHFNKVNSERLRLVRFTFDALPSRKSTKVLLDTLIELYGNDMYLFEETSSEMDKLHYHCCINLQGRKTGNRCHLNKIKELLGPTCHSVSFKLADTYHRREVNKAQGITRQDFAYIYDSKDGKSIIQSGIWEGLPTKLYEPLNALYAATYKENKSKKVPYLTQLVRDYKLSESYTNYHEPSMQTRMIYGTERRDIFESIMRFVWNYSATYNNSSDCKKFDLNLLKSFSWTIYNCYYESKGCDFDALNPFSHTC